jgi:hypothetical protein
MSITALQVTDMVPVQISQAGATAELQNGDYL